MGGGGMLVIVWAVCCCRFAPALRPPNTFPPPPPLQNVMLEIDTDKMEEEGGREQWNRVADLHQDLLSFID